MRSVDRPDGTVHQERKGILRRLRLRRRDGTVYLDRWGVRIPGVGAVMLHRMEAPDPGIDLHDHPWWFCSIILRGGYRELRAGVREAPTLATLADRHPLTCERGHLVVRKPLSVRTMRLDECHTITRLRRPTSWSLVIAGPVRRRWGFYLPDGWMNEHDYDRTVRSQRRDLSTDIKRR